MKLFQFILLPTHVQKASGGVINHHSVAVIDDAQWRRLVVEAKWRQVSFSRIADVNRRLVVPGVAGRKFRVQVAPMTRPIHLTVIPIVLRMVLLCSAQDDQDKRNAGDKRNREIPHL